MQRETILGEARAVADRRGAPACSTPGARELVEPFREAIGRSDVVGLAATLLIALCRGGAWAFLRVKPDFAARTQGRARA